MSNLTMKSMSSFCGEVWLLSVWLPEAMKNRKSYAVLHVLYVKPKKMETSTTSEFEANLDAKSKVLTGQ